MASVAASNSVQISCQRLEADLAAIGAAAVRPQLSDPR
jgi:hypothetical protein